MHSMFRNAGIVDPVLVHPCQPMPRAAGCGCPGRARLCLAWLPHCGGTYWLVCFDGFPPRVLRTRRTDLCSRERHSSSWLTLYGGMLRSQALVVQAVRAPLRLTGRASHELCRGQVAQTMPVVTRPQQRAIDLELQRHALFLVRPCTHACADWGLAVGIPADLIVYRQLLCLSPS